jgi:hypothetical protein
MMQVHGFAKRGADSFQIESISLRGTKEHYLMKNERLKEEVSTQEISKFWIFHRGIFLIVSSSKAKWLTLGSVAPPVPTPCGFSLAFGLSAYP